MGAWPGAGRPTPGGRRHSSSGLPILGSRRDRPAGFQAQQTYGLLAPAGTPAEIVKQLNTALQGALASDLVKARIAADGAEPAPGSPEDYVQDIDKEETKWSKVVEEAGAKEK